MRLSFEKMQYSQSRSEDKDRNRREKDQVWQREPARGDVAMDERRPDADNGDDRKKGERDRPGEFDHPPLQISFCLHDEPGAAEQGIGDDEAKAGKQAERRDPIESAASVGRSFDLESVDNRP